MSTRQAFHRGEAGRPLALLLLLAVIALAFPESAAAQPGKWQTMTFTEDLARDMEEFSKFCLLHDVASGDVLWANNCSIEDLVPGRDIYLPNTQADLLLIWQNRGAWKPKALVQVTSAAAAERARGTSGFPPRQQTPPPAPPSAAEPEPKPTAPVPQTANLKPASQLTPKPKPSVPMPQAEKPAQPKPAPSAQPKKAEKTEQTEPILLLSPDGDSSSGPMRLVISGDAVAIVHLPKSAAPRTPSIADLDSRFGISLIPGPLPPLDNREPYRNQRGNIAFGLNRGGLIWPVNGAVSSYFGRRWNRQHSGLDIPMPPGTPIRVARDGVVAATGNNGTPGFRGYGNFVLVDHGRGFKTLYAHCLKVDVKQGQRVRQGEFIATVGRTGRATTDHLHFEIRVNDKPVDPIPFLPQVKTAARK